MTSTTTKKPILISINKNALPHIMVPLAQLEQLRTLLDASDIHYWVDEYAISIDGKPEITFVNLRQKNIPDAVRQCLDVNPKLLEVRIMALADDIQQLAEHSKAALDASHDYYTHTKEIWRLLEPLVVDEGRKFVVRNTATGSIANEHDLLGLSQHYIARYFSSQQGNHERNLHLKVRQLCEIQRWGETGNPRTVSPRELGAR
jgi:hypothetical protein